MKKSRTKPEVFIIESLELKNEKEKEFEGKFLSQILQLKRKKPIYYYIRTKKELKKILGEFEESRYRYLHLSCHGNETSIRTTLDCISFPELGNLVSPYLEDRRLFISACSVVNHSLAGTVIPSSQCYSIIGPKDEIFVDDAAIVYASFYHLVFETDRKRMGGKGITMALQKVANAFDVSLNYFWRAKSPKSYSFRSFEPQEE